MDPHSNISNTPNRELSAPTERTRKKKRKQETEELAVKKSKIVQTVSTALQTSLDTTSTPATSNQLRQKRVRTPIIQTEKDIEKRMKSSSKQLLNKTTQQKSPLLFAQKRTALDTLRAYCTENRHSLAVQLVQSNLELLKQIEPEQLLPLLHLFCKKNELGLASILLASRAIGNASLIGQIDPQYLPALIQVLTKNNEIDILCQIFEKRTVGADVNQIQDSTLLGQILNRACELEYKIAIDKIICHNSGFSIHELKSQYTKTMTLMAAAEMKNSQLVTDLIQQDIEINYQNSENESLLFVLIREGLLDQALILIKKGANLNVIHSPEILTALLKKIVKNNDIATSLQLIRAGAHLNSIHDLGFLVELLLLDEDKNTHSQISIHLKNHPLQSQILESKELVTNFKRNYIKKFKDKEWIQSPESLEETKQLCTLINNGKIPLQFLPKEVIPFLLGVSCISRFYAFIYKNLPTQLIEYGNKIGADFNTPLLGPTELNNKTVLQLALESQYTSEAIALIKSAVNVTDPVQYSEYLVDQALKNGSCWVLETLLQHKVIPVGTSITTTIDRIANLYSDTDITTFPLVLESLISSFTINNPYLPEFIDTILCRSYPTSTIIRNRCHDEAIKFIERGVDVTALSDYSVERLMKHIIAERSSTALSNQIQKKIFGPSNYWQIALQKIALRPNFYSFSPQVTQKILSYIYQNSPTGFPKFIENNPHLVANINLWKDIVPQNIMQIAEKEGLKNIAYHLMCGMISRHAMLPTDTIQSSDFKEKILETAIENNNAELIRSLLQQGASFTKIKNPELLSALFVTMCCKIPGDTTGFYLKTTNDILNINFDVNLRHPSCPETPLTAAVTAGQFELIKQLIENMGAKVNIPNRNRISSLQIAIESVLNRNNEEIALYLINHGAALALKNQSGNTILHIALYLGLFKVATQIMDQLDVAKQNNDGATPFYYILYHYSDHSAEPSDTIKNRIQFFKDWFKDNPDIVAAVDEKGIDNSIIFFQEHPEKLLQAKDANPFDLPFMLNETTLLKDLILRMDSQEVLKMQIDLITRFPHSTETIKKIFINSQYCTDVTHYQSSIDLLIPEIENSSVEKPKLSQSLLNLFKNINFSRPTEDFYINPTTIFGDKNETMLSLQRTFEKFLVKVSTHQAYLGTPPETIGNPPIPNPALADFYNTIEAAFYHTMQTIQNTVDPKKARELTESFISNLLKASPFCGTRIYADTVKEYKFIVLKRGGTYEERLLDTLQDFRQILFESLIPATKQSVHDYPQYIKALGGKLGIPGTKMFEKFQDQFPGPVVQQGITKVENDFIRNYDAASLVNWVSTELNQSEEFKTAFGEWVKKHVPSNSQYYKQIEQEFEKEFSVIDIDEPTVNINQPIGKNKKVIKFLESNDIFTNPIDRPHLTPIQAIRAAQIEEYFNKVIHSSDKPLLTEVILNSLIEQKILNYR